MASTRTVTDAQMSAEWADWHRAREEELRRPHGWLSLTALHRLDATPRRFPGLPGRWRATGDGGVALTADGDAVVDGAPVGNRLAVAVEAGERLPG
jgi:uncharacterized protein (DUF1684 family)